MSSRNLEARSVGNAVKWSELMLNTFGPTTLRHYIDSQDAALAQSILDNVAVINQILAQKVNRTGDTFTGPVYLLNASTEPNAPVTHAMLDARVNQLLNNAPAALDTLGEIADFIENNADAIGTLTSTKLDRTGDTAHGLSNDGWFTSLNNTGWRTSHGSGFFQTSPLRLEVFGPALLSAANGVESSQFVARVGLIRSVFRFEQGAAATDFYRDPNGNVGLFDNVFGDIWRLNGATGDFEVERRIKINFSTLPGNGNVLAIDSSGYLYRTTGGTTPVGGPIVGTPVGGPVVGGPVVGGPVVGGPVVGGPVVGGPVVGGPVVGGPVVGAPVGGPVVGGPIVGTPVGGPVVGGPIVGTPVGTPVGAPVGGPVVGGPGPIVGGPIVGGPIVGGPIVGAPVGFPVG